jgi:hypothetical protein
MHSTKFCHLLLIAFVFFNLFNAIQYIYKQQPATMKENLLFKYETRFI